MKSLLCESKTRPKSQITSGSSAGSPAMLPTERLEKKSKQPSTLYLEQVFYSCQSCTQIGRRLVWPFFVEICGQRCPQDGRATDDWNINCATLTSSTCLPVNILHSALGRNTPNSADIAACRLPRTWANPTALVHAFSVSVSYNRATHEWRPRSGGFCHVVHKRATQFEQSHFKIIAPCCRWTGSRKLCLFSPLFMCFVLHCVSLCHVCISPQLFIGKFKLHHCTGGIKMLLCIEMMHVPAFYTIAHYVSCQKKIYFYCMSRLSPSGQRVTVTPGQRAEMDFEGELLSGKWLSSFWHLHYSWRASLHKGTQTRGYASRARTHTYAHTGSKSSEAFEGETIKLTVRGPYSAGEEVWRHRVSYEHTHTHTHRVVCQILSSWARQWVWANTTPGHT